MQPMRDDSKRCRRRNVRKESSRMRRPRPQLMPIKRSLFDGTGYGLFDKAG